MTCHLWRSQGERYWHINTTLIGCACFESSWRESNHDTFYDSYIFLISCSIKFSNLLTGSFVLYIIYLQNIPHVVSLSLGEKNDTQHTHSAGSKRVACATLGPKIISCLGIITLIYCRHCKSNKIINTWISLTWNPFPSWYRALLCKARFSYTGILNFFRTFDVMIFIQIKKKIYLTFLYTS